MMGLFDRLVIGPARSVTNTTGWAQPDKILKISWPFANVDLDNRTRAYKWKNRFVIFNVWATSRIVLSKLNTVRTHNIDTLLHYWKNRGNVPLLTVSNHHSCFDDPGIWGALSLKDTFGWYENIRWAACAAEMCFTTPIHINFFTFGRNVPIMRGAGVYQQGMDFFIERLNANDWVHFYPEARINVDRKPMRWKWGIGRLIAECEKAPIVLPVIHMGMHKVMPNVSPFRIHSGNKVTFYVGDPIGGIQQLKEKLAAENATPRDMRKAICDLIQYETWGLENMVKRLHEQYLAERV